MRFIQGFFHSLTLIHKRVMGQDSVTSSSILINQLRREQIYRGLTLFPLRIHIWGAEPKGAARLRIVFVSEMGQVRIYFQAPIQQCEPSPFNASKRNRLQQVDVPTP